MKLLMLSMALQLTLTGFFMSGDISESGVEEANHPPFLNEKTPDPETIYAWVEYEIDVSDVFSDADGDKLTYSALSQSPAVATVEVEGNYIKVMAQKVGKVNIIVTASDQKGGTSSTVYRFTVK